MVASSEALRVGQVRSLGLAWQMILDSSARLGIICPNLGVQKEGRNSKLVTPTSLSL